MGVSYGADAPDARPGPPKWVAAALAASPASPAEVRPAPPAPPWAERNALPGPVFQEFDPSLPFRPAKPPLLKRLLGRDTYY